VRLVNLVVTVTKLLMAHSATMEPVKMLVSLLLVQLPPQNVQWDKSSAEETVVILEQVRHAATPPMDSVVHLAQVAVTQILIHAVMILQKNVAHLQDLVVLSV